MNALNPDNIFGGTLKRLKSISRMKEQTDKQLPSPPDECEAVRIEPPSPKTKNAEERLDISPSTSELDVLKLEKGITDDSRKSPPPTTDKDVTPLEHQDDKQVNQEVMETQVEDLNWIVNPLPIFANQISTLQPLQRESAENRIYF
jgi:hypothetical protein